MKHTVELTYEERDAVLDALLSSDWRDNPKLARAIALIRGEPVDQPAPTETVDLGKFPITFPEHAAPNCPECYFPPSAHYPSCPRLAHALANPPGPMHCLPLEQPGDEGQKRK